MSIHRIDLDELFNEDLEWACPQCGARLYVFPEYLDGAAFACCFNCDQYWVDTVNMLRWLAALNQDATSLFPGSDPNEPPKDNFSLMLGGDNPDSGRNLSVGKLLQFIADMLEE
jgi:hypothetical protein